MLLFLDIDGVLRRQDAPRYHFEKPLLDTFEEMVRSIDGLEIVISSSWKDAFSLDSIRAGFSADIAERILAFTPTIHEPIEYIRYHEIQLYLRENNISDVVWAVIDDDPAYFPDMTNAFYTDPKMGIQDTDVLKIMAFYGK